MATGLTSWKLAKGIYIIPLLFAYTESISGTWQEKAVVSAFAIIGLFAFTAVFTGYLFGALNVFVRVVLFICAMAVFCPGALWLNLVGVFLLFGIGIYNKRAL